MKALVLWALGGAGMAAVLVVLLGGGGPPLEFQGTVEGLGGERASLVASRNDCRGPGPAVVLGRGSVASDGRFTLLVPDPGPGVAWLCAWTDSGRWARLRVPAGGVASSGPLQGLSLRLPSAAEPGGDPP